MCLTQCQGCKQSLIRGQHGILWSTSTNMNMTGEAPTLSFVCRRLISDILWKFAHHRHNWFKIWPKRTVGVVYLNQWGTVEKGLRKGYSIVFDEKKKTSRTTNALFTKCGILWIRTIRFLFMSEGVYWLTERQMRRSATSRRFCRVKTEK